MTQTIVSIVLFLVVLALLPLAIRWFQQRAPRGNAVALSSRVLSSVAVGPQQRVVTVEVGPQGRQVLMVLGVTAHNVNCLHVFPHEHAASGATNPQAAGGVSAFQMPEAGESLPPGGAA
jgi:flagellar protein FliO/FliZ